MNETSRARTSSAARLPWPRVIARVAEAGIEEAGVVGAQLSRGRVVGEHLRCIGRRDADALGRQQQVEDLGLEHDALLGLGVDGLPVVLPAQRADLRQIYGQAVLLGAIADGGVRAARGVEAEEQAIAE